MKIDFHAHAFPLEFFHALHRHYPELVELTHDADGKLVAIWAGTPLPEWDGPARLTDLQEAGIDLQILSNPPIYNRVDEHAPELCRMVNDALAGTASSNPQRLRAFAHLPFNDPDAALNEMTRALDQLGCVGIVVTSNVGGRYLDELEFLPFWEEVSRRRVCVFMHPSRSPCYQDSEPGTLLSFPFDTTLAAYRLIRSGLFDRYPDLVLVLAHLGGALPYLAHRIDIAHDFPEFYAGYPVPAHRPSRAMRKLYVDTALGWSSGAFNCARELVGIDHIVFGSDYFLRAAPFMTATINFIEKLQLKPDEREKIYYGNAARILKLEE